MNEGEARVAEVISRVYGVSLREATIAVLGGAEGIVELAEKNKHAPGVFKAVCEAGRRSGLAFMAAAKPKDRDPWAMIARSVVRRGKVAWHELTLPAAAALLPGWEGRSKRERSAFTEAWHKAAAAHES